VIVGAPGEQNSTGKVYQCTLKSKDCKDIPFQENSPIPHLGMTLASNMQGNKMIACGPGVEQHCDKNLYVSGICYLFNTKLQNPKNITTGYQKCLKGKVDLVFLFDGSASMKTSEFLTIKEFMIDVMKELWNSSVHFAAVQFSEDAKLEFDFNDYTSNPNPEELLANVLHAEQITNTFKAIKFVALGITLMNLSPKEISNGLPQNPQVNFLKFLPALISSKTVSMISSLISLPLKTGSYFGGVLCAVDIDGDQETDLLLIGAQQYFTETRGGRVYAYGWEEDNLILLGEFNGNLGYPLGRFGAAITDLADVNGDGQMEVAIGAPLEDEERGAVYIYNSHEKTLQMEYSQRITGASVSPGLRYFGQSIHGKTDLGGDGLTSIAVGALGKVMVLQSRPIVNVATQVTFEPKEIPVKDVECAGHSKSWQNVNLKLRICFDNSFATKSYTGQLSATLLFRLEIDPDRVKYRGEFRNGKNIINGAKEISLKPIPFDKNCGTDDVCVADLNITFHSSGSKELVVSPQHPLEMNLELVNQREDAYFTTIYVPHLPGLSFRKYSSNPHVTLNCDGMIHRPDFQGLACNVSHPIFRNSTKTVIQLQFGVLENVAWKDDLEMVAYVTSENEDNATLPNNKAHRSIPVMYPINIIVKGLETSSQYIDFSSKQQENKNMTHSYQHCATDEYLIYKCDLGQINSSTIHITGMMSTQNNTEHSLQTKLCTALWVEFDTGRYKNFYGHEFAQVQVTEVEVIITMNYLPIIIGSVFGGLLLLILCIVGLWKCGFFKRNYKQKIELQGENENGLQATDNLEDGAKEDGSKTATENENESKFLTEPLSNENESQ
ncbi:hypothetical protein Chor_009492, partial [Crotalus horridus]